MYFHLPTPVYYGVAGLHLSPCYQSNYAVLAMNFYFILKLYIYAKCVAHSENYS
jgi:hypothetical protein